MAKPSPPRDVLRQVGERIDSLLDDPEITVDEVRVGLRRLLTNRKWGPGMLPNLVDEYRQEQAGQGAPLARREQEHQARTSRAMQRAIEREGAGQ
jgi:hypothetical protein